MLLGELLLLLEESCLELWGVYAGRYTCVQHASDQHVVAHTVEAVL
jgi:hypothetical protein